MRHFLLASVLFVPALASAQNYVSPERYNNPDIVVNLDVLAGSGRAPAPVYREALPAPRPPVVLTPPAPRKAPLVPPPPVLMPPAPVVAAEAPIPPAMPTPVQEENKTHQLLAQARAEAAVDEHASVNAPAENRSQILFDAPPKDTEAAPEAMPAPPVPVAPVIEEKPQDITAGKPLPAPPQDELTKPPMASAPMDLTAGATTSAPEAAAPVQDNFEAYRLFFDANASELKTEEQAVLRGVIAKLKRDESLHAQILAYAAGTPDTVSQARRLSLARALSVRTMMINDGIAAQRLNVRAMGMGDAAMADKKQPADRVDVIFEK